MGQIELSIFARYNDAFLFLSQISKSKLFVKTNFIMKLVLLTFTTKGSGLIYIKGSFIYEVLIR